MDIERHDRLRNQYHGHRRQYNEQKDRFQALKANYFALDAKIQSSGTIQTRNFNECLSGPHSLTNVDLAFGWFDSCTAEVELSLRFGWLDAAYHSIKQGEGALKRIREMVDRYCRIYDAIVEDNREVVLGAQEEGLEWEEVEHPTSPPPCEDEATPEKS